MNASNLAKTQPTFFFILLNKLLARGCDEDTWLTCERLAGCKWAEKGPGILSGGDGTQLQHGTKTFTERWKGGGVAKYFDFDKQRQNTKTQNIS